MSSNTSKKQLVKRAVANASDVAFYAGNPPGEHHNLKGELTTSFKDSYKSLSQPKPESKPHSKPQPKSKADLEVWIATSPRENSVNDEDVEDGGRKETSALKEAGVWASKVFNHSMATRGLY